MAIESEISIKDNDPNMCTRANVCIKSKLAMKSSKDLISKPGSLNPMFGKTRSETTKQLISIKKSKTPLGLYDENNNFSPMGERNF